MIRTTAAAIILASMSLAWAGAALVNTGPPAVDAAETPYPAGTIYIVSVGINSCLTQNHLNLAISDAKAIASALNSATSGFQAVSSQLLLDGHATKAGIVAALNNVAANAKPKDTSSSILLGLL